MKSLANAVLAVAVALVCCGARADDAADPMKDETDWLVARRNGAWELVAKGPLGRVHKEYPNQEVLRLVAGGTFVEVMSMPPIKAEEVTACSQRARRDARDPCSSSFLACRPDPAGPAGALAAFVRDGTAGAADRRNRLACRVDVEAILAAAREVGMIRRILPVSDPR